MIKKLLPLFILTIILFGQPLPYQVKIAKEVGKHYKENIRIEVVPLSVKICNNWESIGCTYQYKDGSQHIVIQSPNELEHYLFRHTMYHELDHYFNPSHTEAQAEEYAIRMDGHDYGFYSELRLKIK